MDKPQLLGYAPGMAWRALWLVLLAALAAAVSGCGGKQSRVVLLRYDTEASRKTEEARLNAALDEGWRVVGVQLVVANNDPVKVGSSFTVPDADICHVVVTLEK